MTDTGQTGYAILHEGKLWVNEQKGKFYWGTSAAALNSFGNNFGYDSDEVMDYWEREEFIKKEKKKLKVIKVKVFMEVVVE